MSKWGLLIVLSTAVLLSACGGGGGPSGEDRELESVTPQDEAQQFLKQGQEKLAGMLGDRVITESPYQVLKASDFDTKYLGRPVAWGGQVSDATVDETMVVLIIAYSEGDKVYRIHTQSSAAAAATNSKGAEGGWVVFTGTLAGRDDDFLHVKDMAIAARRTMGAEAKTEEYWSVIEQVAGELK